MKQRYRVTFDLLARRTESVDVDAPSEKKAREMAESELWMQSDFEYEEANIINVEKLKLLNFWVFVKFTRNSKHESKGFNYREYHSINDEALKPIICRFYDIQLSDIISIEISKK